MTPLQSLTDIVRDIEITEEIKEFPSIDYLNIE
jgi:hypothetical protein